jgi:predicted acylesterase/phospholipase RssA
VVTGVSVGALIAPFAFLGPEYDETLARVATELRTSDIYERRLPPALLWSDSLADSAPLRRRIAAEVTHDLLAKVAREHASGRRLYVGTTDLDTKRLVVWDLGAIAAGKDPGRLDLFRNVLLASASVPGVLPPVAINVQVDGRQYTELHVDGGVSASLFLQPAMLGLGRHREHSVGGANTRVYVIVAGKLRPHPRPVARRLFPVAGESIEGVLQSRFEGDLLKTYLLARFAGAQFALTGVPEEFSGEPDGLSFEPHIMRELFDQGYRFGADGTGWHSIPPGLSAREHQPPRGGVVFTVEDARQMSEGAHPPATGLRSNAAVQKLFDQVREDIKESKAP